MKKNILLAAAAVFAVVAVDARAAQHGAVQISFAEDSVSIVAQGATAGEILREWARIGRTEIRGAELLESRIVTLKLDAVSEVDGLREILGKDFGFAGWPRSQTALGVSRFERLVIGVAPSPEKPRHELVDPSAPPEAKFSYFVPEKARDVPFEEASWPAQPTGRPAPEETFTYYQPDKTLNGDYTAPQHPKIDPQTWQDPETRFTYFSKALAVAPPKPVFPQAPTQWIDPEVRFRYFVPSKTHSK